MASKITICERHDRIDTFASDIESILSEDISEAQKARKMKAKTKRIQTEFAKAKKSGQAMEDRLYIYRNAIEEMGFKRK